MAEGLIGGEGFAVDASLIAAEVMSSTQFRQAIGRSRPHYP